ncbi:hypothetical protein [Cupriavidus sp. AU9028]|uniref:hypothetical protein n=1 Tax=Cupriavidus sp. AU9028 TaxID=2871157 RepID=UPI001C959D0C|nr:hypothetical protein [Cupriavidus sp. AU9028]MBY4897566.1 hypothetical protein [Cupriavidus sp. AU9028]
MLAITKAGVEAAQRSDGSTTTGKDSPIGQAVQATRTALKRCGEMRFPQLDENGHLHQYGFVDVEPALALLDHVEAMIPKYLILPGTRQRIAEAMMALSRSIDNLCKGIDTLNTPGGAAEAVKLLNAVQSDQQTLINLISKEIPDESKMRHIRDGAQAILLLIGIIAVLVSVSLPPLGVPLIAMAAISLSPSLVTFLWNRAYDWRTTPNPAWKPLRDLVCEIRQSMEKATMYATAMMKRMDARMDQLEQTLGERVTRLEQAHTNSVRRLESEIDGVKRTLADQQIERSLQDQQIKQTLEEHQRTQERMLAMLEALMGQRTTAQHSAINLTTTSAPKEAANERTCSLVVNNHP